MELQKFTPCEEKLSTGGDKSGEISYTGVISSLLSTQHRYTQVFNICGITQM